MSVKVAATIAGSPVAQAALIGGFGGIASLVGVSADLWGMEWALWITAFSILGGIAFAIFFGTHAAKEQQAQSATLARVDGRTAADSPKLDEMLRLTREMSAATLGKAQQNAPVDESAKQALEDALERLARDAAAGSYTAAGIVERRNVSDVVDYLSARVARLEAGRTAINQRVDEELIAVLREKAAVAYLSGRIPEAEEAAQRVLSDAPEDPSTLNILGLILRLRGQFDQSADIFHRVHSLAVGDSDKAAALNNAGSAYAMAGNFDVSLAHFGRALRHYESVGDESGVALTSGNIANVYMARGDVESARQTFESTIQIYRRLNNREGLVVHLNNLGGALSKLGRFDDAEGCHREALEVATAIGYMEAIASSHANLAAVYLYRNDFHRAHEHWQTALTMNRALGRDYGVAACLGNLALVKRRRGDLVGAKEVTKEGLALDERMGRIEGIANHCFNLGVICDQLGQRGEASLYWQRAQLIYQDMGNAEMAARASEYLASLD